MAKIIGVSEVNFYSKIDFNPFFHCKFFKNILDFSMFAKKGLKSTLESKFT